MYVIPKDKEPLNKSRLIASYCKHPLRKIYKNTASVLIWCLNKIKKLRHFTLYSQTDLRNRIHSAQRWLRRIPHNSATICLQTDVKQMYTHLSHKEILHSIKWLIDHTMSQSRTRNKNKQIFAMTRDPPHSIHLSSGTPEDHLVFTKEDLLKIVNLDLTTSYQTKGNDLFLQTHGCQWAASSVRYMLRSSAPTMKLNSFTA